MHFSSAALALALRRLLLLTLLASAAVLASTPPLAISAAPPVPVQISTTHQAAVRTMLKALQLDQLVMSGIQQKMKANPQGSAMIALVDSLDMNQFLDKLVPVFAATYSEADASAITPMLQSSPGVKFINALKLGAVRGGGYRLEDANLSDAEQQQLVTFLKTPIGAKFMQFPAILQGPATQAVVEDWILTAAREKMAAAATAPSPADGVPVDPQVQFIRQVAAIRTEASLRATQARLSYSRELLRWHQADLLSAQTLVSASAIAAGKVALVSMGEALERNVQEQNALLKDLRGKYLALSLVPDMPAEFMQGVDQRMALAYDQQIRVAENRRAQLALSMQLLDFAQQHLGTIVAVGSNLKFASSADQEIYEQLAAQLEETRRRAALLASEAVAATP